MSWQTPCRIAYGGRTLSKALFIKHTIMCLIHLKWYNKNSSTSLTAIMAKVFEVFISDSSTKAMLLHYSLASAYQGLEPEGPCASRVHCTHLQACDTCRLPGSQAWALWPLLVRGMQSVPKGHFQSVHRLLSGRINFSCSRTLPGPWCDWDFCTNKFMAIEMYTII